MIALIEITTESIISKTIPIYYRFYPEIAKEQSLSLLQLSRNASHCLLRIDKALISLSLERLIFFDSLFPDGFLK